MFSDKDQRSVFDRKHLSSLYKTFYETEGHENSDLAPLVTRLRKIIDTDGTFGVAVFGQHMPGTCKQLLSAIYPMQ